MDKKLKNELFKVAVDYLFREKKASSQKELAEKIGITEQSLSRVMNGGRTVSDKTLRLMNEAFGGIFNMAYFRGEDPHCMLMEDLFHSFATGQPRCQAVCSVVIRIFLLA